MINLMIGGASLLRGVPGLPRLILRKLPPGKDFDRTWIALLLTLQIVAGAILGIAAQAILIVGILGYLMPWLGLGLLDMARSIAEFNLRVSASFSARACSKQSRRARFPACRCLRCRRLSTYSRS
jgi:hypothetical protein